MRPLVLCQSCKRHVKAIETSCPFCSAAVGTSLLGVAVRGRQDAGSPRGLPGGRAALFLAGAALASGCGDDSESDAGDDENDVMVTPVYGVAVDAGKLDAGRDAGRDSGRGMATPPYGISIDPGRRDASIATPSDAGPPCAQFGSLPVPVYGVGIDAPARDLCRDAGPNAGLDAGKDTGADAGKDAGRDAGFIPVPPYGISIDPKR